MLEEEIDAIFQDLCPNQRMIFLNKLRQAQEDRDYSFMEEYEIQTV